MKCPHCSTSIHNHPRRLSDLVEEGDHGFQVEAQVCPACHRQIIELVYGLISSNGVYKMISPNASTRCFVYPKAVSRVIPREVPARLAQDYREAATILADSPKASAALSRRILQNILHEYANIKKRTLYDEITAVIDEKALPSHIADELDSIRIIGNWAAHPKFYETTGEIVAVEPNEAEACLDAIDGLFDHFFVQPAKSAQRRSALQAKIAATKK